MEQLAQELLDLVKRAKEIEADQNKKTQALVEREALATKKEGELDLRGKSLDAREAIIVPIENITQFKKDAQALLDTARSERETLNADKATWAKQVQADKGQIEEDRKTAATEAANNVNERKNLEGMAIKRAKEILNQFGHSDLADKL